MLAWIVTVLASGLGNPAHALGPRVLTALLLIQIWRGARWGRVVLMGLAGISAGFAIALGTASALGAEGIASRAEVTFALYAAVGGLLVLGPVDRLLRPAKKVHPAG